MSRLISVTLTTLLMKTALQKGVPSRPSSSGRWTKYPNRKEPGLEMILAVEAENRDPIVLEARQRLLETIAKESRKAALRGDETLLSGTKVGGPCRWDPHGGHGADRRRHAAEGRVGQQIEVVDAMVWKRIRISSPAGSG